MEDEINLDKLMQELANEIMRDKTIVAMLYKATLGKARMSMDEGWEIMKLQLVHSLQSAGYDDDKLNTFFDKLQKIVAEEFKTKINEWYNKFPEYLQEICDNILSDEDLAENNREEVDSLIKISVLHFFIDLLIDRLSSAIGVKKIKTENDGVNYIQ